MIRIETREDYFKVYYKDFMLLSHSHKKPVFFIGSGTGTFKEKHASFKIKETKKEIIALKKFRFCGNTPKKVCINFEDKLTVTFEEIDRRLHVSFSGYDSSLNRFIIRLNANTEERIYGCGEQYSVLNMRGRKVPLFVEEQGIGRGKDLITLLAEVFHGSGGKWSSTYFPQPTFISSENYFCHVETSANSTFNFKNEKYHELNIWDIPGKIIFDKCETAQNVISSMSGYLGRQLKLPEWTYDGVWLGVQGGTETASKKLADAQNAGVKVGALWIQDWEGRRVTSFGKQLLWNWTYHKKLYADFPEFIKSSNSRNVKILGYINPFLAIGEDDDEKSAIPAEFFYNEAKEKNYCIKKSDNGDYLSYVTTFPAATIDLTNPDAFKWIKEIIKKEMIGIGLSGWMCDFAEYVPVENCKFFSGEKPEYVHNQFPVLWAKANYEALEESGKLGEAVFFMRSGYTGSSKYSTAHWAGDQLVNWSMDDGLASVIPAALSLGFCGVANHHSDIGGYTTAAWIKRSKELFMRWTEQAAFSPIMRTHEGNRPESNWQFNSDEETLSHFAKMTGIFTAMKEYHLSIADEYQHKGIPMMRHPYIHYENVEECHNLKYQYMYGPDLMVAPVYKKGQKKIKIFLPGDKWINIWDDKEYYFGWYNVSAPLGQPAVFYRKESKFSELFKGLKKC